jgi:hypothetical protein
MADLEIKVMQNSKNTGAHKNYIYRSGAHFFDNANHFFTPDKKCSVILDEDYFDGTNYTAEVFFEQMKPYFDQPELFYKPFNIPAEQSIHEITLGNRNNCRLFSFPSPVQTPWIENNTVYYRMFTAKPASDTVLIFVPGWARANLKAEEAMCMQFLKNNIDSCLITKPFHQERKPVNTLSGELFISGNIFLTVMNFRQLVAELRFLISHFRKTYKNICLLGMSSGGFQTALAADVEEVDFYFPIITGAKLGSITWESRIAGFVKKDIIKKGISEDELNKAWAIADQYYLGSNCKAKYIKQFISLYDEVVPPEYQYLLWEIYNRPDFYEMHCGHVSIVFYFKRIVERIANFIAERKTT